MVQLGKCGNITIELPTKEAKTKPMPHDETRADRHIRIIKNLTTDLNRAQQANNDLRKNNSRLRENLRARENEILELQKTTKPPLVIHAEPVRKTDTFNNTGTIVTPPWTNPRIPSSGVEVYPIRNKPNQAWVLDERSGDGRIYARGILQTRTPIGNLNRLDKAAIAYFIAHPEPNAWENAKPGEAWLLTIRDQQSVFVCDKRGFFIGTVASENHGRALLAKDSRKITAGKRIWPKENTND